MLVQPALVFGLVLENRECAVAFFIAFITAYTSEDSTFRVWSSSSEAVLDFSGVASGLLLL